MTDKLSNKLETVAGIDIAKETFNVFIIVPNIVNDRIRQNMHYCTYERDSRGISRAIEFCKQNNVRQVVIESTSIYHIALVNAFRSQKFVTNVINSGLVRSAVKKPKRDKLDARRLAELLIRGELSAGGDLKPSYIPDSKFEIEIRKLCRLQDNLSHELTRVKNRIHKIFDASGLNLRKIVGTFIAQSTLYVISSIIRNEAPDLFIKSLKRKQKISATEKRKLESYFTKENSKLKEFLNSAAVLISDVDRLMLKSLVKQFNNSNDLYKQFDDQIKQLIYDLPEGLHKRFEIAKSLPGIADHLGIRIAVEFGDLTRFKNRRQVSSYTGLEPYVVSSGGKAHIRGITKSGNKHLRAHLFLAAEIASRHNPKFRSYYKKLRQRGRKYNQAICAIARKIAVEYYFLVKKQVYYDIDKHDLKYTHIKDW